MTKNLYVDIHILQTVPPANANRDDQGNPKEAQFGGVRRSRVSSQAWKRATRMHFAERVPEQDLGTRTRRIASELTKRLHSRSGIGEEQAGRIVGAMLEPLGISAGKKAGNTAYLLFVGRPQLDHIVGLVADQADELAGLDDKALSAAVANLPVRDQLSTGHPLDVALFGRMVADISALNVDAAVQVAHALSTHATELEFDYYTAVDDEQDDDDPGAGMIGTIGFNSATLYRYATVAVHQLSTNLGEKDAVLDAVDLFVDSFARSMPTGYTNSFAHRTLPSTVAVVVRDDQPVNLVSAFEKPVFSRHDGIAELSAQRLAGEYERIIKQWGDKPLHTAHTHGFPEDSTAAAALIATFGKTESFPAVRHNLRTVLNDRLP